MAKLTLQEDKMALRSRFEDKEIARSVPGREWDPPTKSWMYPVRPEILNELTLKFPGLEVSPNVMQAVTAVVAREQAATISKLAG